MIALLSEKRIDAMCELNVKEQVTHLTQTKIVQYAWQRQQSLSVHGWLYNISGGILNDLNVLVVDMSDVDEIYRMQLRGK